MSNHMSLSSNPVISVLAWIPVMFLNVLLVVIVQVLFFYTIEGPVTENKLYRLPYFNGKRIESIAYGDSSGYFVTVGSSGFTVFVVYEDSGGLHVVQVNRNRFVDRYALAPFSSAKVVETQDSETRGYADVRSYLGYTRVTVSNSLRIDGYRPFLYIRTHDTALFVVIFASFVLQAIEAFIVERLIKQKRR